MIKIGFFPAHPAQVWMMKALYDSAPSNVEIKWYIRDKDISKELIESFDIPFTLVSRAKSGIVGNGLEMFFNIFKFLKLSNRDNINLWFSKYGSVNIASWLLNIKNISFNDDDADIVPLIAYTSYPFATKVLCTNWTRMNRFESNLVRYTSFHELFYLHPKRFTADLNEALINLNMPKYQPYIIIRLSSLKAHHDVNQKGISNDLLLKIINKLEKKYKIFISSEKKITLDFEPFRLKIPSVAIHNIIAHASFVLGDSQTMIAEAGVLGIPNLRISTFKGKIGYLNELEQRGLCSSISPKSNLIIPTIEALISRQKEEWLMNKSNLINSTIDPVDFFWKEILNI